MFAVSSIRPVPRRLLALATLALLLASLLPVANATPFSPRSALANHTVRRPSAVTIAGDLQEELGLPGRLAAGVRRHAPHLRRRRHGLAGLVPDPDRQLAVQGRR